MNLPKEVIIMGHQVQIVERDYNWKIETDSFGQFFSSSLEIHVSTGVPMSHIKDTLLHEINHAIWFLTYLPEKADEEEAVSRLSTGLNSVMTDPRNTSVKEFLWS